MPDVLVLADRGKREDGMARIAIQMAKLGYDMAAGRIAAWSRKVATGYSR